MMKNRKEVVVLEFDLPEFDREDIEVKVEKDKISIEAKKKEENKVEEEDFKWFEKSSRTFSYVSSLPPVVGKDAWVSFSRGRLKISIPKR